MLYLLLRHLRSRMTSPLEKWDHNANLEPQSALRKVRPERIFTIS